MNYKELIKEIELIDNDDENITRLEKAVNYFCSNWDICEGYKHALIITLQDQYENHESEQDPQDLNKLSDIINGAI